MIQLLMIVLLLLPLVFQFIFGIKGMKGSISLSFWKVSLISVIGQVFSAIGNLYLISELITLAHSRDGLPWIGVLVIELFTGFILLATIFIQGFIQYRKNKTLQD